jgi:dihydroxy-acid dehydratase
MPELLAFTATLMLRKNLDKVALITDGRFSGATSGPCIGHVCPEAYVGGPIAIVEDGDIININIKEKNLNIALSEDEIQQRMDKWNPIERKITSKALLKYKKLVSSAAEGAIFKL